MIRNFFKRHKYGAKATEIDGFKFSSKKEANYYNLLKIKRQAGDIVGFDLQPQFLLQPSFQKDGKKYREIRYVADFRIIHNNGSEEIVDCKGFKTDVYMLKRKMFEYKYPNLTIKEI